MNPVPIGTTATISVTGLGRSGTTMISRTLLALDLPMGSKLTPQSAEDKKIQTLLKTDDLNGFTHLCRIRDAENAVWAFKCPALVSRLEECVPRMRKPRIILTFRDILAISQRNALSVNADLPMALETAAERYVSLVRQIRSLSVPILLISYEKALQYPQELVQSIAEFCGKAVSDEQVKIIADSTILNADPRYTGTR